MNSSGKASWGAPQGSKDEKLNLDAVRQREQEERSWRASSAKLTLEKMRLDWKCEEACRHGRWMMAGCCS